MNVSTSTPGQQVALAQRPRPKFASPPLPCDAGAPLALHGSLQGSPFPALRKAISWGETVILHAVLIKPYQYCVHVVGQQTDHKTHVLARVSRTHHLRDGGCRDPVLDHSEAAASSWHFKHSTDFVYVR